MHAEALIWLAENRPAGPQVVLDLGSREAGRGRVRDVFADAPAYCGIDAQDGPGVDTVGDICDRGTWPSVGSPSVVVCAEVLEHLENPLDVIANAYDALAPGGVLLITAAAPGRDPHSCRIPGLPQPGEFYENVEPALLELALKDAGFVFVAVTVNDAHHDVYATAFKPTNGAIP